jgi:hypothetical protein
MSRRCAAGAGVLASALLTTWVAAALLTTGVALALLTSGVALALLTSGVALALLTSGVAATLLTTGVAATRFAAAARTTITVRIDKLRPEQRHARSKYQTDYRFIHEKHLSEGCLKSSVMG